MIRKLKTQPTPRTNRSGQIVSAIVYHDGDWEEFRVVPTIDGREMKPTTHYHTDDRDDAYSTAARMIVDASDR